MSEEASVSRRHFLTVATGVTGVVGLAFTAAPFIASFRPSTRARALGAPVAIDISKLDEGAMVRVVWRGQPVWVLRRSKVMLERLAGEAAALKDAESNESIQPAYAKNDTRALRPEYLVVIGNCTHLGCAPIERFEVAPADLGADWVGGFFCPCHGSKFDLAARVMSGSPAPTNLTIPPYRFVGDELVIVGEEAGASA
ncbi:MAG: ubiquinol-cytochrome c reductase iron-sulfur subunit [Chromatiales bacterium]|jgi:ubiquinol-cytochrome c reductase iron-sulfur subunit|nr:MAG: ubiquinol-cytochrome c reductase iron-sulfur subunit [Chromatiales bacterium]